MIVCGLAVLVAVLTVFVSRLGVLPGLVVLAMVVMVRGLEVVVGRGVVVGGCLVMVFSRRVFGCLCHERILLRERKVATPEAEPCRCSPTPKTCNANRMQDLALRNYKFRASGCTCKDGTTSGSSATPEARISIQEIYFRSRALRAASPMTTTTLLLIVTAGVGATPARADTQTRPNIVLIVADDLGWADLGCYGSTFHRTPNIDRLAARGLRFTQSYSASPVCSPSRVALLTGKHPARVHLTDWLPGRPDEPGQKLAVPPFLQNLPLAETTLAEALDEQGYTTLHVGKWHLGGAGFGPREQGFDVNIAGDGTGTPLSYFAPFARGNTVMPGLEEAPAGEYLTDRLTTEAERLIEANKAKPFFLYFPHYAVHTPMSAKTEMVERYPRWDGQFRGRQQNPINAAMLESLDQSVGRIVAKLEEDGLTDKTVIVFTSDNGGLATREDPNTPATNNSPLREGKGWLYEGGIRVPLLVCRPGIVTPGVESYPVWSADIFSTLCDWGGATRADESIDGKSLAELLEKPVAPNHEPRTLYWHYPHYANQGSRPGGAIREGDW
jgi:arylsulfatase A-like enzyme